MENVMINTLYGDGIHDDTAAIQELIDNAGCELRLPLPAVNYLISRPLEIPSNFSFILPRFAKIRLADGSNCVMLRNKLSYVLPEDYGGRFRHYLASRASSAPSQNINIVGGIWDCNNQGQAPNPIFTKKNNISDFWGFGWIFYKVNNLKISDLTVKDPTTFGITLDTVSYVTVENITFDYNHGNPMPINMDGVHLCGNCHYVLIRNLKGACYDDLVALNADEGTGGPITNVEIDGIFAEDCNSAVRMLSAEHSVINVHISNVFGSYYQFCLGLTSEYGKPGEGVFDAINIDNIYVSKAIRYRHMTPWPDFPLYPIIYVDPNITAKHVKISKLQRDERKVSVNTMYVCEGA